MLDLRRLQALHAVVATGSVKDAAARLGYTPSAVSQHITTLERETSTVLLEPPGEGSAPPQPGGCSPVTPPACWTTWPRPKRPSPR